MMRKCRLQQEGGPNMRIARSVLFAVIAAGRSDMTKF